MAARKTTKKTAKSASRKSTAGKALPDLTMAVSKKGDKKSFLFRLSKNKKVFAVSAVLVLLGLVAFRYQGVFLAANVNGHVITKLTLDRELEKLYGEQVLDNLVTKEIILQEAQKQGVEVEDAEIAEVIDSLKSSLTAQGTSLEDALAYQGQTMDDLRENIFMQKSLEKLLANSVSVTDEDVLGYYDENKDALFSDQEYDDVKTDIKDQLTQQKLSEEASKWIADKRSQAQIKYYLGQ